MGRKLLNSELGRPSVEEFRKVSRIPVVLVLDNIRSQFNIGAAFRTADAFAAEKLYLCGICATPPSAEIHKSALGAELSMEWQHFDETSDAVQELRDHGYTIVSIEQAEGSIMLDRLQLPLQQRAQSAGQFPAPSNNIAHDSASFTPAENSTANLQAEKYALVFGNEVAGVQQSVVDMSDAVIEIPQCGTKHSINVSVSIGVVLWEFFQRLRG
jgi:23S rRNA (guanosine2251-2'-O)-methyltransferase